MEATTRTTTPALSLSGGGMRGYIQVCILDRLCRELNKEVPELFPVIAGTSVGSAITAMFSVKGENDKPKYSTADGLRFFTEYGRTVFSSSLWRKVGGGFGLIESTYARTGLESVVNQYLGDVKLYDCIGNPVITTYDTLAGEQVVFSKQQAHLPDSPQAELMLNTAVFASTAAPTYFKAYESNWDGVQHSYVDGGVGANDPSLFALAEIEAEDSEVLLVHLGTGLLSDRYAAGDWGDVQWAPRIIDTVFEATASATRRAMRLRFGDYKQGSYFDLNPPITKKEAALDDWRPENLENLKAATGSYLDGDGKACYEALVDTLTRVHGLN